MNQQLAWFWRPSIRLALLAVLTALVTVLTIIIEIPVPATQGYINLGDVGVFLSGLLMGPLGGLAGGLGSALADAALGYFQYVPITLIVKGFQATLTGTIFWIWKPFQKVEFRLALALLVGSIVMVTGYLLGEAVMVGLAAAVIEVPGNLFQVTFGSILAAITFISIDRIFFITKKNDTG
ncbi:MAG: ECF transporter S component [Candidatus Thorarchaeota archaeon]